MDWVSLQLWTEDEEKRIHACLFEALQQLIASRIVSPEDGELKVSGDLRPHLLRAKKKLDLISTVQFEAASFEQIDSPKPYGHPDIRFSFNTPDFEQYDYDVECKLVRVKRQGRSHDYCKYYIEHGVQRFQDGVYAQSLPPMGAMIGYVQEGSITSLLELINDAGRENNFSELQLQNGFSKETVTCLTQRLQRHTYPYILTHLWADIR